MRILHTSIATAALVGVVSAQQLVVPENMVFFATGTSTTPFRNGAIRQQYVYDTTHFTNAGVNGPIVITRLRCRAEDTERNSGGQAYTVMNVDLSSCPVDHAAITTTFATNRGADRTTVFSGPLTNGASSGTFPNNYNIDIVFQTPFTYDPTLGLDLCVELDAPAPAPLSMPAFATGSVLATHRGQRNAATTQAATVGVLSAFPLVMLFDFTGPGGYPAIIDANAHPFGASCGAQASSFFQGFTPGEAFDLANTSLMLTPSGIDNYNVTAGTTPVNLTFATGTVNITDDGVVAHTPGFTFPFPGGTTTSFSACTNGYVWLGSNTVGDFSPTITEFFGSMARIAPIWHDFNAARNTTTHAGSGMYVATDLTGGPGNGVTYVTWKEVGEFNTSSVGGGHSVNSFQVALFENGSIELRYGSMTVNEAGLVGTPIPLAAAITRITGFSRGIASRNPGSRDLSHEVPFSTNGPDGTVLPLLYTVSARPIMGTSVTFTANNIPAGSLLGASLVSLTQQMPGLNFPPLGSGCIISLQNPITFELTLAPGSSVTTIPLVIPTNFAFLGASAYSQYAVLDGTSTLLSSNGLQLIVGLN